MQNGDELTSDARRPAKAGLGRSPRRVVLAGVPRPDRPRYSVCTHLEVVSRPRWPRVSDVETLAQLDHELAHEGVQLVLARDVGQVRDGVRRATDDPSLAIVYPTVQAAVDAAQHSRRAAG
jgi:hypothetical protein